MIIKFFYLILINILKGIYKISTLEKVLDLLPYFEAKLRVDLNNFADIKEKLDFCNELAINHIIIEPIDYFKEINIDIKERIEKLSNSNIYYRINLETQNIKEFKKKIKNVNTVSDIISIETLNPKLQLIAARDSRVDLLSYTNIKLLSTLSKGVLSLANQHKKYLEFGIKSIMSENKHFQSKMFRILYKSIKMAIDTRIKFIISGGFKNKYDFRNPRALISIVNTLIDIPMPEVKRAFNINVLSLINKAKNRVNPNIIEEGVELIPNGETFD